MATYKKIPALAAYIDRIGAEELNFKRFMIKEYDANNYYKERCIIKIESNGDIKVTNSDYAPTKQETEAIKEALQGSSFPKCVRASEGNLHELKEKLGDKSTFYEFWDRDNDTLIMVQQRTVIKGKKTFIPWSFWSDGQWRMMEPEQKLPFWKPRHPTGKTGIMVHEGAKTAAFVQELIQSDIYHPWKDELKEYEHWGMIGGALAPHRTDYNELIKAKPTKTVYICDNDYIGKRAISEISKQYGKSLSCVMFDENSWPISWDMADPMPKKLFEGDNFIGPSLECLMRPATWATEAIVENGKKPHYVLRSDFIQEWAHCVIPDVYVHRDMSNKILNTDVFNDIVKPFSDVEDTARLVKADAAIKSYNLIYNPSCKSGIFNDTQTRTSFINTHCASYIKPVKGDATPWLEFMNYLIVNDNDRHELMRWIATLIARPEIKMLYGVLLISEQQGVGKSTLGEKILLPILGRENVSVPSESEIVDSNYNYWCAHKRLAIAHEIYAGHSVKAYNNLKSLITDKHITVSQKYMANYQIENWIHIFACSNNLKALKLSMEDRRWFIPKVTEIKRPFFYWVGLNNWLTKEQGLGIIVNWAFEFIEKYGPVQNGEGAPSTTTKKEVIEEGFSPGMTLVAKFLDRVKREMPNEKVAILDIDLVKLIKNQVYEGRHSDKLEKPLTIRKVAKQRGWKVSEKEYIKKRSLSAHIIASDEDIIKGGDFEILNIEPLANKWTEL